VKLILAESNPNDAQLITSRMASGNGSYPGGQPQWEIELARSASECLELLAGRGQSSSPGGMTVPSSPPDLLLLDAELPGADPFELLDRIKHEHPHLPVIMLMPARFSGKGELDGTRAMHQGAQSYVTKGPSWESRLPLMVERWLRGARAQEQVERAASELSFLRQHYQTLLTYTRDAVVALSPAGSIVHFSPTAERVFGCPAEHAIGEHISIFYDPAAAGSIRTILATLADPDKSITADDLAHLPGILRLIPPSLEEGSAARREPGAVGGLEARPTWLESYDDARQQRPDAGGERLALLPASGLQPPASAVPEVDSGNVIRYEAFLRHSQGHFIIFEVTMAAVRDERGNLTGYLSFCRELTEERQAQRELLRSKALLQTIMDTAPVNILILGATGNIAAANKALERSLGYMVTELIGEQAADLAVDPARLSAAFARTIATGEPQQLVLQFRDPQGQAHDHQVFTALIRNSQGEITGIIAITADLSEHRGELDELHAEFDQVHGDELKARALFETAATIADSDDLYGVFSHIARSAVEHLDFDEVTMYRADPEQGLLLGVVKAEGADPLPYDEQIKLVAGADPLADFVLSGETHRRTSDIGHQTSDLGLTTSEPAGRESAAGPSSSAVGPKSEVRGPRSDLLVRVSPPGEDAGLVGIIRATNLGSGEPGKETAPRPITLQQTGLLCSLARLGSVANERARMERLRSQLIASVSHELRTPLAAIRAYNELLLDGDAGPINDEQHLFLSRIEFTSIQLGRILDDLLDLSRMRAGELSVRKGPTDVAACTQHIINTAQSEARKKDISIESRIQPDLPVIVTDSDRLCQVLMNLVDNAVKYSHEGASVLVEARVTEGETPNADYPSAEGPELVICVADNGPGIPPGDLEKIFQEFHRGDAHAEHKPKGAGLGLAIVSRLVRLLGGTVSVDSTVGEGSTFYLRFPLDQMTGETPGTTVPSGE